MTCYSVLLEGRYPGGVEALGLAAVAWRFGCLALVPSLFAGRRWAWAAMAGALYVDAAHHCARLGYSAAWLIERMNASSAGRRMAGYWALQGMPRRAALAVAFLAAAVLLFQARGWFRVDPRRAWSTMVHHGWWMIALGIAVYLPAVLLTLARRF